MSQRKGRYVGNIKIEFCIACSRGHSTDHFGTTIMYLAQLLITVITNSVIQNMHYEKLNLLSELISKFYIKLFSTTKHNLATRIA